MTKLTNFIRRIRSYLVCSRSYYVVTPVGVLLQMQYSCRLFQISHLQIPSDTSVGNCSDPCLSLVCVEALDSRLETLDCLVNRLQGTMQRAFAVRVTVPSRRVIHRRLRPQCHCC